jgi:dTDP-4-amino-4,6-dideoxygalactose transaminase
MIPLIKADLPTLDDVGPAFWEALATGRVTNFGPHVQLFERNIADYVGAGAVCVSSATAGLIMTLQALPIPRGCRVVIPSFSFVATAQAVLYSGCVPVFVDIGRDGNVDTDDLARVFATHGDVRAALLVHMYGLPCDSATIGALVDGVAEQRGEPIPVVYDSAHAFGSSRDGIRVGNSGSAEVFSTSVTKVMTSIEGGIVTSHDEELLDRLRRMRNYGIQANYDAHWPGLNGKMSELHAIVGIHNLARLDRLVEARQQKAAFYIEQVRRRTSFRVMAAPRNVVSTYKDFTIELPTALKPHREAIMAQLSAQGVETRAYFYPPIHEQQFFRRYADRPLPVTEDLSRRVITLPFWSTISEDDMVRVVDALVAAENSVAGSLAAGEVRQ